MDRRTFLKCAPTILTLSGFLSLVKLIPIDWCKVGEEWMDEVIEAPLMKMMRESMIYGTGLTKPEWYKSD